MSNIGLKYSIPNQIPVLNSNHISKRLEYVKKEYHISDESYFQLHRNKERCWYFSEEQNFVSQSKERICFMVWAAISWNSKSNICIKPSGFSFNSDSYIQVLQEYLIPFIYNNQSQVITRNQKSQLYFLQDSAPCHKSKQTIVFIHKQNIRILEYPPNSPDLNAIEPIWLILKRRIEKQRIQNKQQLEQLIMNQWRLVEQQKIQNCILHFKHRIKQVEDLNGCYY